MFNRKGLAFLIGPASSCDASSTTSLLAGSGTMSLTGSVIPTE
jgi:hypothetical protein